MDSHQQHFLKMMQKLAKLNISHCHTTVADRFVIIPFNSRYDNSVTSNGNIIIITPKSNNVNQP